MKSYFTVVKTLFALFIATFMFACSGSSDAENKISSTALAPVAVQANDQNNLSKQPVAELSKDQVCMVNNAYMGKKQIPVAYDNKTYYGCCQMCVEKIKTNKAVRYATDPYTGKEVDKASAFIALN